MINALFGIKIQTTKTQMHKGHKVATAEFAAIRKKSSELSAFSVVKLFLFSLCLRDFVVNQHM